MLLYFQNVFSIDKLEKLFFQSFLFLIYSNSRLNIHIRHGKTSVKSLSRHHGCATIYRISDIYHDGSYLHYDFSLVVTISAIINGYIKIETRTKIAKQTILASNPPFISYK